MKDPGFMFSRFYFLVSALFLYINPKCNLKFLIKLRFIFRYADSA